MKILLTGVTGFVGLALRQRLIHDLHDLVAVARKSSVPDTLAMGDIGPETDWQDVLQGCEVVVHLAARVHVMEGKRLDAFREFRRINVKATENLACQAAKAGVRRFVFISSIKVNGEDTDAGRPFTADDVPAPQDPYGVSKFEAEQALKRIADQTGMEVVILRPPLVYGPGVKANFRTMLRCLERGIPLPLAAVGKNRRSLVALDNLVDLIAVCMTHPDAANQVFLVSDGEDMSTAELLRRLGEALGKPARLIPIPVRCLKLAASLLKRQSFFQRLCGSLQVDIGKTRDMLGWQPPISVDDGLRRAAKKFSL
jgi:nucleoside-diphosphate-sugar epimerase